MYRDTQLSQSATPTKQKLRHTYLAPGLGQGLPGQHPGRLLRQVTFTHYIAVPLANIPNISDSLKMKKLHKMYFARSLTFSRLYLT